jgi:hypothetical protein
MIYLLKEICSNNNEWTIPKCYNIDESHRLYIRSELKYEISDNIVRTFVNATMYPNPAQQLKNNNKKGTQS